MAEKVYRVAIEGHLVEFRRGEFGVEELLIDGRSVSRRILTWSGRRGHHTDLTDATGRQRHLEVRLVDESSFGLGKYVVLVALDGVPRARLTPLGGRTSSFRACLHCGYSLSGAVADRDELRCPECGRHTPESVIGRGESGGGIPMSAQLANEGATRQPAGEASGSTGSSNGVDRS